KGGRSMSESGTRGWRIPLRLALALLLATAAGAVAGGAFVRDGQSATTSAFVRVNQIGYPSSASKRAYLMSSADEIGATFSVRTLSGTLIYSAPIGIKLGSWSKSYPFVYALDFGTVGATGNYTISVSGPVTATSPSFKIGAGATIYSGALANALSFYRTER